MMEHLIVFVVTDGVQLMDIAGPADVFTEANSLYGSAFYRTAIVAPQGRLQSSCGFRLEADFGLQDIRERSIDTLLVAGSPRAAFRPRDAFLADWLTRVAPQARRYGSICGGLFPLAESGLLNGRSVAAHWADVDTVRERFPSITVDADALIVEDGPIWTAAGVSSGLDLALAMVKMDLGEQIARDVARQLVLFYKRPGGQQQYSRNKPLSLVGRSALQHLQRHVIQNPCGEYRVDTMARLLGLERRQVTRIFSQETGISPAQWVEQTRLALARRHLEDGIKPLKSIAAESGFGTVRALRRVFMRHIGVTPSEYRKRF